MHIRPADPSDFSSTASMSVSCFWNDELYIYTNPYRTQHPDHFRDLFLRRHHRRYWSPGFVFLVVVTDPGDQGHEEQGAVVGYSVWERRGKSEDAKGWRGRGQTWRGLLERTLLQATEKYIALTGGDKSLEPARLAYFLSEAGRDFNNISELWKLQNLCVHPDYQGRGIGSMLIRWGQEQAQKEKVPIGLESSMAARSTYLRNGFRKYGQMHIKDFPIKDVPTFIWEPKNMEGRWGMQEEA